MLVLDQFKLHWVAWALSVIAENSLSVLAFSAGPMCRVLIQRVSCSVGMGTVHTFTRPETMSWYLNKINHRWQWLYINHCQWTLLTSTERIVNHNSQHQLNNAIDQVRSETVLINKFLKHVLVIIVNGTTITSPGSIMGVGDRSNGWFLMHTVALCQKRSQAVLHGDGG